MSETLLDAMYNIDQNAHLFPPAERAAIQLAERLTTDPHGINEEVWAALREHFDEGEIVELVSVVGLFNYFNRFNETLKIAVTPADMPADTGTQATPHEESATDTARDAGKDTDKEHP